MQRTIETALLEWKTKPNRLPLIIRGARQVGKSYTVEHFGNLYFEHSFTVNFEKTPQAKACFSTFDPNTIINKLNILFDTEIMPGKTLLFLDEIQDCPEALMALRYFKEELPLLHVIAAGSLLEFVLENEQFRMPVGRVQFMYLRPLSFHEFLHATGHPSFLNYLSTLTLHHTTDPAFHQKGLELVKLYMAVGGMPGVIQEYLLSEHNLKTTFHMQSAVLQTYRNDFPKYAKFEKGKVLGPIFDAVPKLVGHQIKYVNISRELRSTEIKWGLFELAKTGIINLILATSANGLPLSVSEKTSLFKCLFLDIGLVVNSSQLNTELIFNSDIVTLNQGALAEQFVGQELIASQDPYLNAPLYFWTRTQVGSQSEVDYIQVLNSTLYPIEVKSGKTGRLRSLLWFIEEKKPPFGIKLSQAPLSFDGKVLSVPLYLVGQLSRLVSQVSA